MALPTDRRVSSLARESQPPSPNTRQHRQLGSIGTRTGPSYSPYARRVASRAHANGNALDDDLQVEHQPSSQLSDSPTQTRTGLLGKVKSLPGRLLGALTRSSSTQSLMNDQAGLKDVRAQVELEQRKQQDVEGDGNGGMTRSRTAHNLAGAAKRLHSGVRSNGLTSSSSLSALSSLASPSIPSQHRSAHSTLVLPHSASTTSSGGNGPSFLTAANLGRHSRAASPALSSMSRQRSPSPLRNGLVGSMSSFNLASQAVGGAQPPSPTSASAYGYAPSTLGNGVASNPFGLTSRSPFALGGAKRRGAGGSPTSSVAGRSVSSSYAPAAGHPLFPYSPALPRAQTPSLTMSGLSASGRSVSMREGLAGVSSSASALGKRPRGSPLNPTFPERESMDAEMDEDVGGAERARKKQMVWDPVKGLVSRERLEKERKRDAPPLPKNEAERILEVLEGMGRTPLGEAQRGTARATVNVPLPSDPASSTRLPRSSTSSLIANTPYAARAPRSSSDAPSTSLAEAAPEKGLQAVLRAREARRQALVEQEREERERERMEDQKREKERERRRERRRREMRDLMSDEEDGVEELDVRALEDDMDQDVEEPPAPRRVTRSAAKSKANGTAASAKKGKNLEPPTPRRSTRAATKSPSPAPQPPAKKAKGKGRAPPSDTGDDEDMEEPNEKKEKAKSASPPPPPAPKSTVPPVPKIAFPAPSSFPAASTTSTGRSSLRPGKSHSSRQHQASSKVFSAREEDLPPVDEEALKAGPAFAIPSGFSFGAPATTAPATAQRDEGSSLLSRLGEKKDEKKDEKKEESAKPAFSFGAPSPAPSSSAPAPPAFSFGAPAAKKDDADKKDTTVAKSDFFAAPPVSSTTSTASAGGFSFATPLTSTPVAASKPADKPNFFGAVLADKKDAPAVAPTPAMPSFTFGTPAADAKKDETVKPTEVIPPTPSIEDKKDASAPVNPFAAFGKPVSEIVKDAGGEEKEGTEAEKPKFTFAFGAPAKKDEEKKDTLPAPDAAPFSFGAPAAKSAESSTPAAPSPFAFGAPAAAAKPADKPASPFTFGAPSTSTPASLTPAKPVFAFGTTPATPKADEEKKEATPAPSLFGGLSASTSKPPSAIDDAGDSGMEDEAEPDTAAPKAATTPAFSFGASSSAPAFGASSSSGGFTFGAPAATADKKAASPAPFSFGAAAPASAAAKSAAAFTFGASPSPSPAPPSPAPGASSFTFGAPASASSTTAPAPSPFAFGATSSVPAFGAATGASTAPVSPAAPSFTFGAASTPSLVSPAAAQPSPFAFGAPSSSAMGSSLSAGSALGASNSAPSFSFGSQPTTPAAASNPSPFAFGASAPSTGAVGGPSGASPFAFGAPTGGAASPALSAAGSFSFGAPAAAPPTPGGGLFNMGSAGDDTPKAGPGGRQIRPMRKPRR
ncbi:hypothetical protein JCM11641_002749 [Rhodosporidiobolus odoratus]